MNKKSKLVSILLFSLSIYLKRASSQQCRQVTVCDESLIASQRSKGQKGQLGAPGKAGPAGLKGTRGEVGEMGTKGTKGEPCQLGSFPNDIQRKIEKLEHLLTPASCRTSSVYGRQILRSGEEVFCDGGWTVVQRRFNGSVSFDRVWNEYKNGFGNLSGEFWLGVLNDTCTYFAYRLAKVRFPLNGLDKIHLFTKGRGCILRVDLWSFDEDHAYAEYKDFSIEDESDNYRLHIAGYSGTAGDSMFEGHTNDEKQFTTKDRDNDELDDSNCGVTHGGWWHQKCSHAFLSGRWGPSHGAWSNIVWFSWKGMNEALKSTSMKIKCE